MSENLKKTFLCGGRLRVAVSAVFFFLSLFLENTIAFAEEASGAPAADTVQQGGDSPDLTVFIVVSVVISLILAIILAVRKADKVYGKGFDWN